MVKRRTHPLVAAEEGDEPEEEVETDEDQVREKHHLTHTHSTSMIHGAKRTRSAWCLSDHSEEGQLDVHGVDDLADLSHDAGVALGQETRWSARNAGRARGRAAYGVVQAVFQGALELFSGDADQLRACRVVWLR